MGKTSEKTVCRIVEILKLLADPTRLKIAVLLAQEDDDLSVSALSDLLATPVVNLSHHLVMMCRGNVIKCRPNGRYRYYRLGFSVVRKILKQLLPIKEIEGNVGSQSTKRNRGVYKITNKTRGAVYVGGAYEQTPEGRLRDHRRILRKGKFRHHNHKLQQDWDRCGEKDFVFEVILKCPRGTVKEEEERWIKRYNKKLGADKVYNLSDGGSNPPSGIIKAVRKRKLPRQ